MSEAEQTAGGREGIWLEKYRPQRLSEVVGHDAIVERLQSYVDQDDLSHMLFAGPAGVGKCTTGDTPVLTDSGLVRMDEIIGSADGFSQSDDLKVLTFTRQGEFEYTEPSHVFGRESEDLVEVETRDGANLTVTPEHKLLLLDGDGLRWEQASEIGSGSRIVRPLSAPLPDAEREIDWVSALDGDRTFVHLSTEFAECHEVPFEENLDRRSTVCSLAHVRGFDVSRRELRHHVEAIEHVTETNNRSSGRIDPPWELGPDLAEFVGLAITEARIDTGRIKFYNTDETLIKRFEALTRSLFGIEPQRGEQKGVPYVAVYNRTVTEYLESCFDVFDSAAGGAGIGSTILTGDRESRRRFLRAVFDAEAHVRSGGMIELTQKNESHITLLSYLLAGIGVPSRRKTKQKSATNGSGIKREYHTLYISGAPHLRTFQETVGFSIEEKAATLEEAVDRIGNPNNDTIPRQDAVDDLCNRLHLTKQEFIPDTLNPETPGREQYLGCVSDLVESASERLGAVQEAKERVLELEPLVSDVVRVPTEWAADRETLDTLDGDGPAPIESLQSELASIVDQLDIPYERIADSTHLRGPEVGNLLTNDEFSIRSLPRFSTVVEQLERELSWMASLETLESLQALHRLVTANVYLDEVAAVREVTERRRVYDLTVPESRNYVAGTVPAVMHNTTSAIAIARELYGEDWENNFLELNASDERGIDVVRDRVKSFARTSFGGGGYRIIFLDEADALCVPPGTEVVTGYPSSPEVKRIEDVAEDGEPIPSVDFDTNEVQSDKGKLVDSGIADFFEVELTDGRTVLASLSHPFFVVGEDGKLIEKELQELSPGDEIADITDNIGVSPCELCGNWTAGRFCSIACKDEGHSLEMQGESNPMHEELPHHDHYERDEFDPSVVSDGGLRTVDTVEVNSIEYSHRGKAYNISMEGTPNFMLGNGILTHNTSDAQAALRRTMEQFSNNVRFILSCNYSSQIIDPIQSRCTVFRFSPLSDEAIRQQVREIADEEGIQVTDDGMEALVYVAGGDMRAAINGLQAAAVTDRVVDEEAVFEITSTARPEDIEEMVTRALDGDFTAARSQLDRLLTEEGIAGGDIIDQLHRSVWEFDLGDEAAVRLLDRIGEADYRITEGANERIQLEALLASVALDS
jgi:DNA polymerase III delta prime subunit